MSKSPLLKIAVYSPYLDTLGGGEKYMLTIAEYLSKLSNVDLLLDQHLFSLDIHQVLKKMQEMHGMDLSKMNLVRAPIGQGSFMASRLKFLRKYDVLICNTDGSIFPSSAKRSYIHFQVPFTNTNAQGLTGKLKMKTWKEAIYNSNFTKEIIEKSWPIKGRVIYPPVNVNQLQALPKKKYILSVGRFFSVDRSKKHQLMIETFKKLIDQDKLKDWALYLAGGASEGDINYLHELENMSRGYRIYIYPNINFPDLQLLYGHTSIYWHAKGFREQDPKAFEHFGISTVEAMAAGCVPIVINLGGQKEIVEDEVSGCLWNTLDEWEELTIKVAENEKLRKGLGAEAVKRAQKFSKEEFEKQIHQLVFGN